MKFEIFTPIVIHELGQRSNQEDSVFPAKGVAASSDRLFLVCDGMGGHARGEVASANVVDAFTAWVMQHTLPDGRVTDSIIVDALLSAHQRLNTLDDGAEHKMGTTLTMVCLHSAGVSMGHVGDSRIYHVRPSQRAILYKSIDHSLVYELYRNGVISHDEMVTSPHRNVITRAVMPGKDSVDKIDIAHTTNVLPGDYFLLCSDGMLENMTDAQLLEVLCSHSPCEAIASTLVTMTQDNKDNHSAVLIKIKSVIAEPADKRHPNDEHISPYNDVIATARDASTWATPIIPEPDDGNRSEPTNNAAPAMGIAGGSKKGKSKLWLLLAMLLTAIAIVVAVVLFCNSVM